MRDASLAVATLIETQEDLLMGLSSRTNSVFVPNPGGPTKDGTTSGTNVDRQSVGWTDDAPFGGAVSPASVSRGQSQLSSEGQIFFGSFLLLGFFSFAAADFTFGVNLFKYWGYWLGSLIAVSLLVTVTERGKNLLIGALLFAAMSLAVLYANRFAPFIDEPAVFSLMTAGSIAWGILCFASNRIMWISYRIGVLMAVLAICGGVAWYFYLKK